MVSGLQDISKQAGALFRRYTIVRVGAAVKSPTGSVATLPLKDKFFIEREVVAASKHFFLLGSWP
jgi:hypothetical protein